MIKRKAIPLLVLALVVCALVPVASVNAANPITVTLTTPSGFFDCTPKANNTVTYVFSTAGVKWSNNLGGNLTITATTIAGSTLTWPTPVAVNSSTIDYHISSFHGVTGDIWFKKQFETICGRVYPRLDAKVKVEGTNSNAGSVGFNLVFTNPTGGTVTTLGNTFTIGTEGFDWNDSTAFSPTWTTSSLTWHISIPHGSFKVDPATIGTSSQGNPTGLSSQRRTWIANGYYWEFYMTSTNFGYQSCQVSATDCGTAATHWGAFVNINTRHSNGQCATDINATISATYLYYACAATGTTMVFDSGSLGNTGVFVKSKTVETTVTLTHSASAIATIRAVTNISIIAMVYTTDGTNGHLETWWCKVSSCFTNTNWNDLNDINPVSGLHTIFGNVQGNDAGGVATIGLVYAVQGTTVDPIRLTYTTNAGVTWSTTLSSTCDYDGRSVSIVAENGAIYIAGQETKTAGGCTNNRFGLVSWTFGNNALSENNNILTPTQGGNGGVLIGDSNAKGVELILAWIDTKGTGANGVIEYETAPNAGAPVFSGAVIISSTEATVIAYSLTGSLQIDSSSNIELAWSTGSAAPFNVQFAVATVQVDQPVSITLAESGAPTGTFTITGCSVSPTTIVSDGTVNYLLGTASCQITITKPSNGAHSRYEFNDRGAIANTWLITTCASGTCTEADNTTYYQLQNSYTATPLNPSTWDGIYTGTLRGTFLGTAGSSGGTFTTANGGAVVSLNNVWFDYNLAVSFPAKFGNSWLGVAPTSFTDTTGGNTDNVNYNQSAGTDPNNYLWLFLIPIGLFIMVVLKKRG